jgi:nitrite reductase/ring-hydroxylating ferredoxin subunit
VNAGVGNFYKIGRLDDFVEGIGQKIKIKREAIAVFKHRGKIFAFQNACPHQNADLAEGYIRNMKIYCRHHHWSFDLESGAYVFNPSLSLKIYPVHLVNGNVYLEINKDR